MEKKRKRASEQRIVTPQHQKREKLGRDQEDSKEGRGTRIINDLSPEIVLAILDEATSWNFVTALVVPFVCRLWRDLIKECKHLPVMYEKRLEPAIWAAQRGYKNILIWFEENGTRWREHKCTCIDILREAAMVVGEVPFFWITTTND